MLTKAQRHSLKRLVLQLAVLALLIGQSSPRALTLVRGPYLGRSDDLSVTVIWRTDVASSGEVRVFDESGTLFTSVRDDVVTTEHRIRLVDLAAGAVYRYEVRAGEKTLHSNGTLRAPVPRYASSFRFAVFGDTDGDTPRAIADALVERDIKLAIHTGDVVYPSGAAEDYDAKFFEPMSRWLERGVLLPTLGNHDAMTARGEPLLRNFVMPVNGDPESRYYSVREGNALFVCIDVETSPYGVGSDQYSWLEQTLRESDATWKFVWFHEPPYSSANSNQVIRFILGPMFERYGVDIVFCGHEHLYERTHPIRDFTPASRGVVYITAGGGGADFTKFVTQPMAAIVDAHHGFVVMDIDGSSLRGSAIATDGTVMDTFELAKPVSRRRSAGK